MMASNHNLEEISVQDILILKMTALSCYDLADGLLFWYLNHNQDKSG